MLHTVGHGTLSADELVALLGDAGLTGLVDVRLYPQSRRVPHFGRAVLERTLPEAGITYRWEPRLGGRRHGRPDSPHRALTHPAFRAYADWMETEEFAAGLDTVLEQAAAGPTVVMCAESVWWRCHRRLVADIAVLVHATAVAHIFHDGRLVEHHPMPEARVDGHRLVYDAGAAPLPGIAARHA